jgi:hypothetical protein
MRRLRSAAALALLVGVAGCGGGGSRTPTVPMRAINVGQEMTGELRSSDPRLNDNSVYHLWTFRGQQGQTVQIDVMSRDFDAFVILQDAMGNELERDDDDGDGLDARIQYTLPTAGTYRIVANTYSGNSYGTYRLRVTSMGMGAPRSGAAIRRGARFSGTLTASDARMEGGKVFHYFLYHASAGETVTIDLESSTFDPLLVIQDRQGNQIQRDDDSGEGTNARLSFSFPYQGEYRIVVTSFAAGVYGVYTLTVR